MSLLRRKVSRERDSTWTIHWELLLDASRCIASWNALCLYGFSVSIPLNGVAATISMILALISYLVPSSFESDSCTLMSSHLLVPPWCGWRTPSRQQNRKTKQKQNGFLGNRG
jgi:hypothetical protein